MRVDAAIAFPPFTVELVFTMEPIAGDELALRRVEEIVAGANGDLDRLLDQIREYIADALGVAVASLKGSRPLRIEVVSP